MLPWSTILACFPSFSHKTKTYVKKLSNKNNLIIILNSSLNMKREDRQHGMVRTYRIIPSPWNPRPDTRIVNMFDSPPICGIFTKVQQKPTNHSKFTGKCGRAGCMHPACKSKDKTKGNKKLINSRDLVSNYKMITWRVVEGRPGLNLSGFSATGILDHLASDYVDDDDDDDDNDCEIRELVNRNDDEDEDEDQDQDVMSYYDVGYDQVYEEDEGWCLLGEMW